MPSGAALLALGATTPGASFTASNGNLEFTSLATLLDSIILILVKWRRGSSWHRVTNASLST